MKRRKRAIPFAQTANTTTATTSFDCSAILFGVRPPTPWWRSLYRAMKRRPT